MKRTQDEQRKYDWVRGKRGSVLIYAGRTPNKDDYGLVRTDRSFGERDVLRNLFYFDLLTGKALQDAQELYARSQET